MLRKRGEDRHAMEGRAVRFSGGKDVFVIQAPAEIQDPASIPAAYRDHADRDKHFRGRHIRQTSAGDRVEHHGAFSYDIIFIGDAVLARYSVLFDFIEGEPIRESAPRQHYADFVMVEMRHEFREIKDVDGDEPLPVMLPSMILALSNGDRVTITVTTSAYFDAVDAGTVANSEAHSVANAALKAGHGEGVRGETKARDQRSLNANLFARPTSMSAGPECTRVVHSRDMPLLSGRT